MSGSMAPRSVRLVCDRGSQATSSNVSHRIGDQNLLSRARPFFGRHVKLLAPAAYAVVSTHSSFKEALTSGKRPVVQIIAESLSQYDEKHVVPTLLSVGKG
jgi:hypothetical protein